LEDDPGFAMEFAAAARRRLEQSDRILSPGTRLVAAGLDSTGAVVVLYSPQSISAVFGQRFVMSELRRQFDEGLDAATLAQLLVDDNILEPSGPGVRLDVLWAKGLIDDPSVVWWIGVGESSDIGGEPPGSEVRR
jgi:hypothetical protein